MSYIRKCPVCDCELTYSTIGNFTKASRLNSVCKPCYRNSNRERIKLNNRNSRAKRKDTHKEKWAEYSRNFRLQKVYGITPEEYNTMFIKQAGCCKLCGTHQSTLKRKLVIDHNHITGNVRGLLCHHCNVGIGMLKEDVSLLLEAINYIKNE